MITYPSVWPSSSTTRTVTTVKEYDDKGRLVKETTTEQSTAYPQYSGYGYGLTCATDHTLVVNA